ncbi:hypothetical protein EfmJHP80_26650 [Enterococcus faecium]|nr:hypothetical protein EfmJHP80_26650 [Enterococcus faecium]
MNQKTSKVEKEFYLRCSYLTLSVLFDKEPKKLSTIIHKDNSAKLFKIILSDKKKKILKKYLP